MPRRFLPPIFPQGVPPGDYLDATTTLTQGATITVTTDDGNKTDTCTVTVISYVIGSTGPDGGLIFYDAGASNYATNGWRYLEAAPSAQSTGIEWYNGTPPSITTGTAIGTGKANTGAIIAYQGAGTAAYVCTSYTGGGKIDWFLP